MNGFARNIQTGLCALGVLFSATARGQSILISEVMADNDKTLLDTYGSASDWIELYNNSESTVDLDGWYLTDDLSDLTQWSFPAITLAPKSFLIVFASDQDQSIAGSELHTNFKLSAGGETVALVHPDGTTIEHALSFPALEEDVSYGYRFDTCIDPISLLESGTACSARIPTGASDATGWQNETFNDSGWLSGTTGVGYETSSGGDVDFTNLIGLDIVSMKGANESVYIRIPFSVTNTAFISSLKLRMKYDDAFVAYLNGTEVARSPNAPATLSWNSGTSSIHADTDALVFEDYDISEYSGSVQPGINMLAIHGLNKGINSTDLIFLPKIEAVYADGDLDPLSVGLLSRPSPGLANAAVTYEGDVETPVTFPERGFYDAPIQVSVSNVTDGATIRYTTDGSTPTESSPEYTGPITISSTTCLRVGAFLEEWNPSFPRTDTYLFVDDIAAQPKTTSSINGQTLEYGMDSGVLNKTYYDASNQLVTVQDALKAIPSISLTTDDANLYDTNTGIYVNPLERWEVPASAELINPDGSAGFHVNAGLRLRGGASRRPTNPKHSFRLFFRSEYGAGKLKYPLFEDEGADEFDKVDLRSAQNYSWSKEDSVQNTFLRDIFARDSAGAMGQAYTRSRYYHLYLNGEYWGLFMMEERPVASFGESYFGGDKDDYDAIKVISWTDPGAYSIEETDGTLDAYYRLYSAAMAGFADNADYFAVQGLDANGTPDMTNEKLLDVDNLIDYLLVIYHMAASDNCITWFVGRYQKLNNMYAIYNRVNPDGFKWIQHDSEHALDTCKALDFTGPFTNSNFTLPEYFNAMTLHEKLSVNEEYKIKFADRVYKHYQNGGAMVLTNAQARLDYRAAQIDRAIVANAARWGSTELDRDTWADAVATTRDWLSRSGDRCKEVIGYLETDGLIPSILPPLFDLNGGQVPSGTTVTLTRQEPDPAVPSSSYYGTPMAVPGTIEAEDYDLGSSGIAYSDSEADNRGDEYRTSEGVDIEECDEGGYNVGWTEAGEWLKYTVNVASAGDYALTTRVARNDEGTAAFRIEIDGIDATGSILVENTGGWQSWVDATVNIGLTNGEQVVTLVIESGGLNINYIKFTDLHTANLPIATPPPAEPIESTIYYTVDGTDPRAIGGGIAGSAYGGPISITRPTHLKARCLTSTGEWSALAEETYWTPEIPLAVTELMYHAPDGNAYDFIEVKNISSEAVSLNGYKLDNAINFKFKNATQTSLAPGEYLVAVNDIDEFNSVYPGSTVPIAGEFSGDFSNSGEKVDLEFRDNDLISFSYDDARNWPQAADGAGHSLVPLDSAIADQEQGSLDYGGNWRSSTFIGGSPGTADPELEATLVLNEISAHTDTDLDPPYDSNDKIELYNTSASTAFISGWWLSDDLDEPHKWRIPDTTIPGHSFVLFDETDFHFSDTNGFGLNKAGEQVVLSAPDRVVDAVRFKGQENEATGVSWGRYPDGTGDWLTTQPTPAAPNQPVAATLRIAELMYHPMQPGNDFEYIQIQNAGTSAHVFENEVGPYRIDGGVEFTFPAGTTLASGERLWILSFNPTNTVKLNQFCSAYGLNAAAETFLGGYSGSLSDRGERVAIERPQDSDDPENPLDFSWVIIDELFYFDQFPWPVSADGTGYPLVRTGLSSWNVPVSADIDNDQMPDYWEYACFKGLVDANIDSDSDGQNNLQEYIAGTIPTDNSSFFSVQTFNPPTLSWNAVEGRTYSIFRAESLDAPFEKIASVTNSPFYDASLNMEHSMYFYRITAELNEP
ncbi:lamin tail domain-containing protein [Pontiellaceae bacterium B12219]|nr:lamin tail domain-containing protein [Pontiellaceae bacterium B12219]